VQTIIAAFSNDVGRVILGHLVDMSVFEISISLIDSVFRYILNDENLKLSCLPPIFLSAYVLALCPAADDFNASSRQTVTRLWEDWLKTAPQTQTIEITKEIKNRLKSLVDDTNAYPLYVLFPSLS